VLSVDARRAGGPALPSGFEVTTHGGRRGTGIDAVEWAARAVGLGVGEILLNSMDADGTKAGFDLELIRAIRAAVTVPVIAYLVWQILSDPQPFTEWQLYVWTIAVAVAELLPVPTNVSMAFSLSFPLELSAAMLFPTPAAAAIAFVGSADPRELRAEVPPLKALFVRAQIAVCVIAESLIFTHLVHPNHSAEFTQILCRQAGQGLHVYVVVAKHALVLMQPEAAQPIRYVHIDLPQEGRV